MTEQLPNYAEVSLERLATICQAVVEQLRSNPEFQDLFEEPVGYHGFKKARIPDLRLAEYLRSWGLRPDQLQVEIVLVEADLSHEVHQHHQSNAVVYILGQEEGQSSPLEAQAYIEDSWVPIEVGQMLVIPAGTAHGFTVAEGGTLTFLSIQSPPIVRPDGKDDYYRLTE
ncbi:hypothetical protein KGQ71_02905 [Patescibacteria group bacterium]|nr:hypothetical protein [Patescibacteria group bacterium]